MKYPIVFVPGLFGSMGDDVIKGTGSFSFGFAHKVYGPFIEILNSFGYLEGLNLFIAFYNWRLPVLEAVDKYLVNHVEKAKKQLGVNKVIIIGHSLGGLLGRGYMAYFNPSSVHKLIMLGTPNLGTVNAYYFWSGGKLPYTRVEDDILYHGLKMAFILYYKKFKDLDHIEALRNMFPVVEDLLPSYNYGNYLFYEDNGQKIEIPIENMSVKNRFLNELEKRKLDSNKIFIISGNGVFTNKEILIDVNYNGKTKWQDGKAIKFYQTNQGDGTVTTTSTLGDLNRNNMVIKGNHTDILYRSKDYLEEILG